MTGSRTAPIRKVELNNAVMADDQVRVAYLLDKEARRRSTRRTCRARHRCTTPHYGAHPPMVEFLLEHGADVNERDRDGWTPIMTAAYLDDAEDVKHRSPSTGPTRMRSSRAESHARSASPRSMARTRPRVALVEVGADPSRSDRRGAATRR